MNVHVSLRVALATLATLTACVQAPGEEPVPVPERRVAANTPPAAAATDEAEPERCRHDVADQAPSTERVAIDVSAAPSIGPADAPVTLVVFSDFQCPFCARATRTLDALEETYGDSLRIAFMNLPLPFHERAEIAARAALAAAEQGRFWQYHDALFGTRLWHDDSELEDHARAVGLDLGRFRSSMDDARIAARVAADAARARDLGVKGTPTFFVNGRRINGAQPTAVFERIIEEELGAGSP